MKYWPNWGYVIGGIIAILFGFGLWACAMYLVVSMPVDRAGVWGILGFILGSLPIIYGVMCIGWKPTSNISHR